MAKKSKKDEEEEDIETTEAAEEETAEAKEEEPSEPSADAADGAAPKRGRRVKKAIKKRKSKKEKENPLARALRLAVETGKVAFGAKTGLKDSLLGKAIVLVVSEKAPLPLQEDIAHYAKLSKIPVLTFQGTSVELGSVCGKPYSVSVLSIYEEGSSGILELTKKK